jgi:hypothetical protein
MRKKGKTTVWLGSPDVAISGPRMSRKKPAPHLMRGGHRFFEKIMHQGRYIATAPGDHLPQ